MLEELVSATPGWVWLILAVALLVAVVRVMAAGSRSKDPKRAFDAAQRHAGFARAGNQCEFSTPWFTRCSRKAVHADHWYPHTRGGASSMPNLVAACQVHNLSKGAKMPSAFAGALIAFRRRKYFPEGVDRKAGEWY